jgi:hypothetical protein
MQSGMQGTDTQSNQCSVFDLGWLSGHPAVSLRLAQALASKTKVYTDKLIGEWSTASIFVEPLVRGLGWDTLDIDQVGRESRRPGKKQVGDIHLLVQSLAGGSTLRVVVEVKHLDWQDRHLEGKPLQGLRTHVNDRLLRGDDPYNLRVRPTPVDGWLLRAVLTNGRLWLVYDFLEDSAGASREKGIGRFELSESLGQQELADLWRLLSRDAILSRARG